MLLEVRTVELMLNDSISALTDCDEGTILIYGEYYRASLGNVTHIKPHKVRQISLPQPT